VERDRLRKVESSRVRERRRELEGEFEGTPRRCVRERERVGESSKTDLSARQKVQRSVAVTVLAVDIETLLFE
jgi:hypothetical protein